MKASFVSADRIASFTTDAESTSRRAALGPLRAGEVLPRPAVSVLQGRARGRRAAGLARLRVVVHARCARPAQARRRRGRDREPALRVPRRARSARPRAAARSRRDRRRRAGAQGGVASASARGAAFRWCARRTARSSLRASSRRPRARARRRPSRPGATRSGVSRSTACRSTARIAPCRRSRDSSFAILRSRRRTSPTRARPRADSRFPRGWRARPTGVSRQAGHQSLRARRRARGHGTRAGVREALLRAARRGRRDRRDARRARARGDRDARERAGAGALAGRDRDRRFRFARPPDLIGPRTLATPRAGGHARVDRAARRRHRPSRSRTSRRA